MERSDERLSTRDIASPTSNDDPRFERDEPAADHAVTVTRWPRWPTPPRPPPNASRTAICATRPTTPANPRPRTRARPQPAAATATTTGTDGTSEADDAAPLLPDGEGFQSRWEEIQVRFVDEPRGAVEDADALVATVMQRLAEGFAQERERLEAQWGRGEDISTEDLRISLQRYRSFFQRLLST